MTGPGGPARVVGGSFRDPSGFVFTRDGVIYRQVNASFARQYDRLVDSGLYEALVDEGLLIPHREVDPGLAPGREVLETGTREDGGRGSASAATAPGEAVVGDAATDAAAGRGAVTGEVAAGDLGSVGGPVHLEEPYKVLRPDPVDFVSYPYEWCPGQLRDAALTTLRALDLALDHGMSLRDASAYNVQFQAGRPVLIDTLSFEEVREGRPWAAYRQFCQHFLAPLALAARVDVRLLDLLRSHVDGVPVDLASRLLPRRTWLRPGLLTHLHLQARAQRRYAGRGPGAAGASFSLRAFRGLVDSLRGAVQGLDWAPGRTTWSAYYAEADHYTSAAMTHKAEVVAGFLERVGPATVWDLGANTGRFSRLAAAGGARVVALDADPAAVEAAWREVRGATRREVPEEAGGELAGTVQAGTGADRRVLPLVMDLANPSPPLGWAGEERDSLVARGPADLVLALALVHHLAIAHNVPLARLAGFLARLSRWLVVEFVPREDQRVRQMLAGREETFPGYSQAGFEAAFGRHWTPQEQARLRESDRVVYLMRAREGE